MHQTVPFVDLQALHAEVAAGLDAAWRAVTASGQFVGGRFVDRFEADWARYCGTAHCVGVSDGTSALKLALQALEIGPGDEVIVPANTFIATWEAVAAAGATPVGVDVDPHTLLMTADAVSQAATRRTAAVIAVHLYGQVVDMDAMTALGRRLGIAVIEDAAQAHGARWRGRSAGSLGDAGCFSFYPSKNLGALGDGGAVVTNRRDVADRVRALGNHGRAPGGADRHTLIGHNHRLDGIQAAILSAKLPHLDRWNAARGRVAALYREAFAGTDVTTLKVASGATTSHHLYVVEVDRRDDLRTTLAARGVGSGVHYAIPCHQQPAFAALGQGPFPVTERAAARIVSLPMFPHLTDNQVARVAETVLAAALPAETIPAFAHAASPPPLPHAALPSPVSEPAK